MAPNEPTTSNDPFDDVLNLEERFYAEGYDQGTHDGVRAGKIEGRSVGLAKGFDKFLESGRLYGKALVWGNRMRAGEAQPGDPTPGHRADSTGTVTEDQQTTTTTTTTTAGPQHCSLPPLPSSNVRLGKNVVAVGALVEPETLSVENSDEAVNDFDDRVKRAQGRAKVVERMIGETPVDIAGGGGGVGVS